MLEVLSGEPHVAEFDYDFIDEQPVQVAIIQSERSLGHARIDTFQFRRDGAEFSLWLDQLDPLNETLRGWQLFRFRFDRYSGKALARSANVEWLRPELILVKYECETIGEVTIHA